MLSTKMIFKQDSRTLNSNIIQEVDVQQRLPKISNSNKDIKSSMGLVIGDRD